MHRITIEYAGPADPSAFDDHYRRVHVPLVAAVPGVRRFTLSHPRGLGGDAPHLVAELWFDDADAMRAAMKSPEMAETAKDAQSFDVAGTVMFTGAVEDAL
jgi:uncharacterized protein (TIGR02118 family)